MLTIPFLFFLQLIPAFLEVEEVSLCLMLNSFLNKHEVCAGPMEMLVGYKRICGKFKSGKYKFIRWENSPKSITFRINKRKGLRLLLNSVSTLGQSRG